MSKTNAANPALSWTEGLRLILESAPPPRKAVMPLLEACGHVCAEAVTSAHAVPPFDNSSMDGYAVRAADLGGASADNPVRLRVVGEVAAGIARGVVVGAGQAAAIMTGAPIPAGADAVVKVESTRLAADGRVEILEAVVEGACVRRAGADTEVGAPIIEASTVITPGIIGLLASCGHATVPVYRRPTVALATSGDEVIPPGDGVVLKPGQIFDSNSTMLRAQIGSWGYHVEFLGRMPDDPAAITETLRRGLEYDYLVTVGGVSMGKHDYLRPCLEALGAREVFWKLNQQPGGPMLYALAGETRVLGLPGNPVSCYVCADIYLRAALRAASGGEAAPPQRELARLEDGLKKPHGKVAFIRAHLRREGGVLIARSTGAQDSNRIRSIAHYDGYILFPEEKRELAPGDEVEVIASPGR